MTTITVDPQPDSPECFRIDATTAPRNGPPSDNRPRLACEWKHVRYVYPPAGEEEDYTSPRHGGPVPDFNGE